MSGAPLRFTGDFTRQEALPPEALAAAERVLLSGRLHRYSPEPSGALSEVSALEAEFAAFQGSRYALAVSSGGAAMALALRALGVGPGDVVLSNAFTLAPVPGAIASLGASPRFVETADDLTIDLDDLRAKAGGAKALLLSHMRGHSPDMPRLAALCAELNLPLIEDCAHAMGARWAGKPAGHWGRIACFSTQSYKHIDSGEGGLLTTDEDDLAARAILLSGSYMLYERHGAAPPPAAFAALRLDVPNMSARMDNLRAAILRPQLALLPARIARWRALYDRLETGLAGSPAALIARPVAEAFVGSSFQFRLPGWTGARIATFLSRCAARGLALKWFGAPEPQAYTSHYQHWRYAAPATLPQTDALLAALFDLRLPLSFTPEDAGQIAAILRDEIAAVAALPEGALAAPALTLGD